MRRGKSEECGGVREWTKEGERGRSESESEREGG